MEGRQKTLISVTFVLALVGIVLIVVSFATDHWVESTPENKNETSNREETDRKNTANFGLFKGYRELSFGLGQRNNDLRVKCVASKGVCVLWPDTGIFVADEKVYDQYIENKIGNRSDGQPLYELGLFNFGFWVTIIICAALAVVFAALSMGFAIFNICGKPIETITGPMGLYIWNGLAFLFSLVAMVIFLVLYLTTLKKNFVLQDEYETFYIEDHTNPGFSFYLLPGAVFVYLLNIGLLFSTGYSFSCSFGREAEKVADNGMILY